MSVTGGVSGGFKGWVTTQLNKLRFNRTNINKKTPDLVKQKVTENISSISQERLGKTSSWVEATPRFQAKKSFLDPKVRDVAARQSLIEKDDNFAILKNLGKIQEMESQLKDDPIDFSKEEHAQAFKDFLRLRATLPLSEQRKPTELGQKFLNALVAQDLLSKIPNEELSRTNNNAKIKNVTHELYLTENNFLTKLKALETIKNKGGDTYYQALNKAGLITDEDLDTMQEGLPELIQNTAVIVGKLEAVKYDNTLTNAEKVEQIIKIYSSDEFKNQLNFLESYMKNYDKKIQIMQKVDSKNPTAQRIMDEFDTQSLRSENGNFQVTSAFAEPMQRVSRYPMTLGQIPQNAQGTLKDLTGILMNGIIERVTEINNKINKI